MPPKEGPVEDDTVTPNTNSTSTTHIARHYTARDNTPLEEAIDTAWDEGIAFGRHLPSNEQTSLTFEEPMLKDAIFCGHLMADLDSIAGAIGAAHLYGGTPARASQINSETEFALQHWGLEQPRPVEELLKEQPDRKVCLVDFQQQTQLHKCIPMSNICGIIDHHALQSSTIVTETPIFVDIRPWGCMSSILAHNYAVLEKHLPKPIAGMLLSAILSDTLNMRSPTTTHWDRRMVAMLVQYLGNIGCVNEFAAQQFRAKSHQLNLMTPYQLVNGDTKQFKFQDSTNSKITYTIGFGVIETTDPVTSLNRMEELLPELEASREEHDLTAMLLAVVDIVHLNATLFLAGPVEQSLALASFCPNNSNESSSLTKNGKALELPGLVSRKKDLIPPLTKAIANGWSPAPAVESTRKRSASVCSTSKVVMDYSQNDIGELKRVPTASMDDGDDEITAKTAKVQ